MYLEACFFSCFTLMSDFHNDEATTNKKLKTDRFHERKKIPKTLGDFFIKDHLVLNSEIRFFPMENQLLLGYRL